MSNFKRASQGPPRTNNVLSALRSTTMAPVEISKPVLPAEIISTILDYLPVRDLMSFGRTSKRMAEMVHDDTRWVQRLKSMNCWNENEARTRFDQAMRRKWEMLQAAKKEEESRRVGIGVDGTRKTSTTLFDAGLEEKRQSIPTTPGEGHVKKGSLDGFQTLSLSNGSSGGAHSAQEPASLLNVFSSVKSIRGGARQEYGKVYAALAPFYYDLARSKSHTDPVIFRVYRDPEQQAQMLAQLQRFALSDWAEGWQQRREKLETMISVFENAVLREFEHGFETWDIDGNMHRYAHVLYTLNGGHAGTDMFIQKHPLLSDWHQFGRSMDCINQASSGDVALEPAREFFQRLSAALVEQAGVMDRIFPEKMDVMEALLDKVGEDIILEYVNPLFDEAHDRDIQSYLKVVSGIFGMSAQFATSLVPTKGHEDSFRPKVDEMLAKVFEPHIDLYLQDELDFFKAKAEAEVKDWERQLTEQDASTESFFMGNINRQADKKDFLSSFKKVVMMPVNVLPSFGAGKAAADSSKAGSARTTPVPSRPQTPALSNHPNRNSVIQAKEAPTDELAAKAAIMASRLEGIKSLFSIEVALNLVHLAKISLGRAAVFINLGGQTGEEAREQCEALFCSLLDILGNRHVKNGFDKAVEHLSKYNAREVNQHNREVAPLVTFLELVNVGDLISQMIDVFYEQQLVANKLTDRNDFLDPAIKAKKKFEQMLDERVAAGLNKGIDVLMDEVDYVFSTTYVPTDYNPLPPEPGKREEPIDISPTKAAQEVVAIVSSHTKMLTGSTDKNMLDVFNQEVGLRLFTAVCKHLKRQRISTSGAMRLISDMNLYFTYISALRNADLLQYFKALRELSQIYLVGPEHAKEMATIIADGDRFGGIFRAEEVLEYAERRADWFQVKNAVEKAMYGIGCMIM